MLLSRMAKVMLVESVMMKEEKKSYLILYHSGYCSVKCDFRISPVESVGKEAGRK